jgi:hypothetical protein
MKIKTENGEVNVASQGQSNLNTVLGAVGTAGSLGILGGLIGPRNQQPQSEGDRPVTRYELGLIRESIAKDTEIAVLKGQQYTDRAMAGVQQQIGMQQTWNAVQQQNIAMMQKQLGDITKFVVPITSIDPVPTTGGTATQTTQTQQGQ